MLKIYHVRGTRSVRPIWLCYELNIPVEVDTVDFSSGYRNSNEWQSISPTGKVPVLKDDELTMFESGAMFDYILERYGKDKLRPKSGTTARAIYNQWCWFAEATLSRPVGLNRILRAEDEDISVLVDDAKQKFHKCLDTVEQAIADKNYIVGSEFTGADIMIGSSLGFVENMLGAKYPNSQAYLDRLRARDACIRAIKV